MEQRANISSLLDLQVGNYFKVKESMKALKDELENLREDIVSRMKAEGLSEYFSDGLKANISSRRTESVAVESLAGILEYDELLQVVSAQIGKVRKLVPADLLTEISSVKVTETFDVTAVQ